TFPVSIDYHARGIKVEEIASRVGIGWALNAGGQITRQIRDKDDFWPDVGYSAGSNYIETLSADDNENFFLSQTARNFYAGSGATGEIEPDRIPDQYNLQVGNLSAKFIIDYKDGKPLLQKYDDIKIVNSLMLSGSYTVTDKEGFKYKFQVVSYELLLENITIGNTITHD